MELYEALHQCQPQSGPLMPATGRLPKLLEDDLLIDRVEMILISPKKG